MPFLNTWGVLSKTLSSLSVMGWQWRQGFWKCSLNIHVSGVLCYKSIPIILASMSKKKNLYLYFLQMWMWWMCVIKWCRLFETFSVQNQCISCSNLTFTYSSVFQRSSIDSLWTLMGVEKTQQNGKWISWWVQCK